jgi:hypothetical protein
MENSGKFVAIGDTVIDAFIKLEVGHVQESAVGAELCIPYGSKVPFESVTIVPAVGNSANAAVAASRLGVQSALVSFLGTDRHGDECLDTAEKRTCRYKLHQPPEGIPYELPLCTLVWKRTHHLDQAFTFCKHLPDIGSPSWIYLSSLGEHAKNLHFEIVEYKKLIPISKLLSSLEHSSLA